MKSYGCSLLLLAFWVRRGAFDVGLVGGFRFPYPALLRLLERLFRCLVHGSVGPLRLADHCSGPELGRRSGVRVLIHLPVAQSQMQTSAAASGGR